MFVDAQLEFSDSQAITASAPARTSSILTQHSITTL